MSSSKRARTYAGASHSEVLGKSAGKRVVCLFTSDGHAAHSLVESWAATAKPPCTLVTLEWERAPRLSDELDDTVKGLASAASSLYPDLYASAKERAGEVRGDLDAQELALERAARRAAQGIDGVSLHSARNILRACRRKQLPLLSRIPTAERVRQLAFALDPLQLVIELFVSDPQVPAPNTLLALVKGAEWLAHNSGARVVMVLPDTFTDDPALDRIISGRDPLSAAMPANHNATSRNHAGAVISENAMRATTNDAAQAPVATTEPVVTVAAPIGRPHPASDAEVLLHEKLCADSELAPLFSYNRLITTKHGQTPRVDLLWSEGRLVIELDGLDHARKRKFCDDRVRDYYLMISGYQVLRFSDMAVLSDVELTVDRIRTVVRFLREKAS